MSFSEKSIQRIVTILKWYYFVFVCLGGFIVVLALLALLIGVKFAPVMNVLQFFLVPLVIFFGLRKRKSWVLILIVVLSSFNIALEFFFPTPVTSQDHLGPIAGTIVKILVLGMNAFTIYFFTRKEVIKYFKATDVVIY